MRYFLRELWVRLRLFLFAPKGDFYTFELWRDGENGESELVKEFLFDGWGRKYPARRDRRGRLLCPGCGEPLEAIGSRARHSTGRKSASRPKKKPKRRKKRGGRR